MIPKDLWTAVRKLYNGGAQDGWARTKIDQILATPSSTGPKLIGQIDLLTQPAFGLPAGGICGSTSLPLFDKGFPILGGRSLQVGPIPSKYAPGAAPGIVIDVVDPSTYVPLSFISWTIVDSTYTNGLQLYATGISLTDLENAQFSAHTQVGTGITTPNNQTIVVPSGTHDYFAFFAYNTAT